MLKTLLKLDSNLNGAIAHLFVEMTGQPMTTEMIAAHCLDFIKQLGAIEAQNKAASEAQAAQMAAQVPNDITPAEAPMPGVEAPQCCQEGQCNQE